MWPWGSHKKRQAEIQTEVERLEGMYGEAAYVQALAVLEEFMPDSPNWRVMSDVAAKLAQRRGDKVEDDEQLVRAYKRVGLWG